MTDEMQVLFSTPITTISVESSVDDHHDEEEQLLMRIAALEAEAKALGERRNSILDEAKRAIREIETDVPTHHRRALKHARAQREEAVVLSDQVAAQLREGLRELKATVAAVSDDNRAAGGGAESTRVSNKVRRSMHYARKEAALVAAANAAMGEELEKAAEDLARGAEHGTEVAESGRELLDMEGEMRIGETLASVLRMASKAAAAVGQKLLRGAASRLNEARGKLGGVGGQLDGRIAGIALEMGNDAERQAALFAAALAALTAGAAAHLAAIVAGARRAGEHLDAASEHLGEWKAEQVISTN
jgi:hypothetical protein